MDIPPSPVLGFHNNAVFSKSELFLKPGDALLLYTDGVTEATDPSDSFYSDERLLETCVHTPWNSMSSLVSAVRDDVVRFAGTARQSDDITMLALRFLGRPDHNAAPGVARSAPTRRVGELAHCRAPADIASLPAFQAVVAACAGRIGIAESELHDIELAVEEVLANILRYAYPDRPGDVEVVCMADEEDFVIEFIDQGIPFDPTSLADPELPEDLSSREIGGLGIYIVKKIATRVIYQRRQDCNVLALAWRLPSPRGSKS